ncbi:MAG: D-alanyl-D-alanine carboxypeptidase [Hyphomicrobiaceae bacterium]|nr:D-alanyl-D-alanine carboxypeptidase [Hyphomicrobiaceae bacterium]
MARIVLGGFLSICWLALAVILLPTSARAIETKAEIALLVDFDTGSVLFEKNADTLFPPASLAKLMTIELLFQALKSGKITLDQEYPVSEYAWRTGGAPSRTSSMYAPIHSRVKVSDLIQGIAVQSANDGALIFAEGFGGTEAQFVRLMNERARELGLSKTTFGNPTGLPHPDNRVSARDLAKLAVHIVREYPEQYKVYAQREFTYNAIRQFNRNPLLNDGIGADGMKTGFIKESGYNLVGSALQNGQRLVLVLGGAKTEKDRGEEGRKLLDWGFKTFEVVTLFDGRSTVIEPRVVGGTAPSVRLVTHEPVKLFSERGGREKLRAEVRMRGPLRAPIAADQKLGEVRIYRGSTQVGAAPVHAADAVEQGTLLQRALEGAKARLYSMLGI